MTFQLKIIQKAVQNLFLTSTLYQMKI